MLKIPKSMYGKGPKNNPAPKKSWDTSGEHAYGDSKLRNLPRVDGPEPYECPQEFVDLTTLRMKK